MHVEIFSQIVSADKWAQYSNSQKPLIIDEYRVIHLNDEFFPRSNARMSRTSERRLFGSLFRALNADTTANSIIPLRNFVGD